MYYMLPRCLVSPVVVVGLSVGIVMYNPISTNMEVFQILISNSPNSTMEIPEISWDRLSVHSLASQLPRAISSLLAIGYRVRWNRDPSSLTRQGHDFKNHVEIQFSTTLKWNFLAINRISTIMNTWTMRRKLLITQKIIPIRSFSKFATPHY